MPRLPGVFFSRGHFVTKFGCGDGPRSSSAPPEASLTAMAPGSRVRARRLVVERDQNRTTPKPVSQITVEDLAVKFIERTRAERLPATHHDYAVMLRKLVYGFPWKRVPWKKGQPEPDPFKVKGEPFTDGLGTLWRLRLDTDRCQGDADAWRSSTSRRQSTTG